MWAVVPLYVVSIAFLKIIVKYKIKGGIKEKQLSEALPEFLKDNLEVTKVGGIV